MKRRRRNLFVETTRAAPPSTCAETVEKWLTRALILLILGGFVFFYQAYRNELIVLYESEIQEPVKTVTNAISANRRTRIKPISNENPVEYSTSEFANFFMRFAKRKSSTSAKTMRCESVSTDFGMDQVCCKSSRSDDKLSCLPSVVVMGVQKGGTTALHSYLMLHPNLQPSKRKELHLFDMDRSWLAKQQFKVNMNFMTNTRDFYTKRVTFETTPSYSASPDTCVRFGVSLPGTTKFVIIVRNPIDRAWSELQMKARRVDAQVDFKELFYECKNQVRPCFKSNLANLVGKVGNMKKVTACIKRINGKCSEVASHSKFKYLFRGIQMPKVSGKHGVESTFFQNCFLPKFESFDQFDSLCFEETKIFREKNIPLPAGLEKEGNKLKSVCLEDMNLVEALDKEEFLNQTKHFSRKQIICWFKYFKNHCEHCRTETNRTACSETCVQKFKPKFNPDKCKRTDYKASTEPFCRGVYCACFPQVKMPSDISKGYVFRGLYNIQFRNCFRFIDRERVLIIYNTELREFNNQTMHKITSFVGLPDFDYSKKTYDDAMNIFETFYPKFEEQTGWSANGTSSLGKHIPDDVHMVLKDIYKDDVLRLRELLGPSPFFDKEFHEFL